MLQIPIEAVHEVNSDRAFCDAVTLTGLLAFAKQNKINFAIDGSLARSICASWDDNGPSDVCSLVGPLSDIDLLCEPRHGLSLSSALQHAFPTLKLFHLETRAPSVSGRPYGKTGYVELVDPPGIWFVGDGRIPDEALHQNVCVIEDSIPTRPAIEATTINWRSRLPNAPESDAFVALLDVLFLLRHNLALEDAGMEDAILPRLLEVITRIQPTSLWDYINSDAGRSRRIRLALLKYLCARHAQRGKMEMYRLGDILPKLSALRTTSSGAALQKLVDLSLNDELVPFRAIVVPGQIGTRWIRDVYEVLLGLTDGASLTEKLNAEKGTKFLSLLFESGRLSPIFRLKTEDPPDPHCCEYYDFSRGHVEAIWWSAPTEVVHPLG